ncbi:beta-lactamase family protein [Flavihumibacter rivuli]|uniref:serine hydrolase domain-containing protein n=1 Tax=Flavihumibacter rivuli TaxID=2838156 RepID=UPI001BDF46DB|nr:serine hydrolase domain-containing protein [Flavihumibacter rivuli]ULQ57683.1 beta-lactamase family protein [Flavihumibacter rivuli]
MAKIPPPTLTAFLEKLVADRKAPGLQYLLTKNGEPIMEYACGFANLEEKRLLTGDTIFNACSVTKLFTSLAVMQLASGGQLQIDDNAAQYCSFLRPDQHISIRSLLNHTTGITNPIPLRWVHLHDEPFYDTAFVDGILRTHLKQSHPPSKVFRYSNINYLLLGKIIEQVSGKPYTAYINEHILNRINIPAGDLSFTVDDYKHYATGYQKRFSLVNALLYWMIDRKKFMEPSGHPQWVKFKPYYVSGKAYGGLVANAKALVTFINTLMIPQSILLNDNMKNILFERQQLANGKSIPMALGWFIGSLEGREYYTHAGGGGGYYCEMRYYPASKIASAIMFNRTGIRDERLLDKVDGIVLKKFS